MDGTLLTVLLAVVSGAALAFGAVVVTKLFVVNTEVRHDND